MHWLNQRRLFIWVLSALAETAVTIPWAMFTYWASGLSDWPAALPGVWLFLFAYGAAAAWEAGGQAAVSESPRARIIAMIVGLSVIYLLAYEALPLAMRPESRFSLNAATAVLPPAAYLWYQGASIGAVGLEYGRVFTRFTRQTAAMVATLLILIMSGIAGDARVQVLLLWSVFLLFGAGCTLIIIARERDLRMKQARHGEVGAGADSLSPAAIALVGGLVVTTLVASYLLSVQRLVTALSALGGLIAAPFSWMVDVAMLLIVRWAMMILMLVSWISALFSGVRPEPEQEIGELTPTDLPEVDELLNQGQLVDWSNYLRAALILTTIVVMLILAYRLVRSRQDETESNEEERIALGFWRTLLADLRGLLRRQPSGEVLVSVKSAPEREDELDPRALFRRLQHWGSALGRPRLRSETPTGYGAALNERRPAAKRAITDVIEMYNRARYGATPPDDEEVRKAARGLEELQSSQTEQGVL